MITKRYLLSFSLTSLVSAFILYIFTVAKFPNDVVVLIIFFLIIIAITIFFLRKKDYPLPLSITIILIFGFLLRSYYSYTIYSTIISPFPDSFGYINNIKNIVYSGELSFKSMERATGTSQFFYYYILFFAYKLFGSYYAFYLTNILLFSVSMMMLYCIVSKDFGQKIGYATTLVSSMSMTMLIFTSNILKDGLVLFLFIATLYIYKFGGKKLIIPLLLLIAALTMTRIYTGIAVIFALIVDLSVNKTHKKSNKVLIALATSVFFIFIFNNTFLVRYMVLGEHFLNEYSFWSNLNKLPMTLFNLVYSPYPYGIFFGEVTQYSLIQIDSAFTLLFSFALVMLFYKVIKFKKLRTKLYLYIVPILIHAAVLGVAYGGGTRQRIGIFSFIMMLFIVGLFYKPTKTVD